jgi:hypothetical protein
VRARWILSERKGIKKPSNPPILAPKELVFDLRVTMALGLTTRLLLLPAADRVIA